MSSLKKFFVMQDNRLRFKFIAAMFFLHIVSAANSVPRGAQELVPCGHWVYDSITAITLESRMTNFADCAPLTIQEIRLYLSEIDYESLSDSGKADYDAIVSYMDESNFSFGYGILSIGVEPSFNVSGFYKNDDVTNTEYEYDLKSGALKLTKFDDIGWIYDRYQRKHAFDLPITVTCGDYLTMSTDVYFGQSKGVSLRNSRYTNIPITENDIAINFPDDGYFSTGMMFTPKVGAGFRLGSGSKSIGRSSAGSIIWSEYLTGVSYGQLEVYCPVFKYTGTVSQFNVDKYMYMHQLDFRPFKFLHLTAIEGMMVYAPMELRFLNPFTVFHGMAPWRDYDDTDIDPESNTCAYLGLKFQLTPFRNFRFYGNFVMTQCQTPYEKSKYSDSPTPNGMGAQLGAEGFVPFRAGRFHFVLEGSWADPYLYVKESPNWSLVRTYSDNIGNKEVFYEWIGTPFGPDSISGNFVCGYEVPEKWKVSLSYLFVSQGEHSGTKIFDSMKGIDGKNLWGGQRRFFNTQEILEEIRQNKYGGYDRIYAYNEYLAKWHYPNPHHQSDWKKKRDSSSPTGTAELMNRITLTSTLKPAPWLVLTAQPGYVIIFNHNNVKGKTAKGFEIALAAEIKLARLKK